MVRFRLLLIILLSLAHLSCASFPQSQLPLADDLPIISKYQRKPTAYIEVFYRFNNKGPVAGTEQGRQVVKNIVYKITRESAIFDKFTFDRSELTGKEYIIAIDMLNHGSEGAATIAGMISALSFWLIPTWATDNYTMKTKVFDPTGKLLAEYRFDDSLKTYFHLIFLFFTKNKPSNACQTLLSNMVRTFYQRLYNDKIFQVGDHNYTRLNCDREYKTRSGVEL